MSSMYFIKPEFKTCDIYTVWNTVIEYVKKKSSFNSLSGIIYKATVKDNTIFYIGGKEGSRLAQKGSYYTKSEFIEVFNNIRNCDYFNTNTIDDGRFISMNFSYKRAPFIGLLYTVGIATHI